MFMKSIAATGSVMFNLVHEKKNFSGVQFKNSGEFKNSYTDIIRCKG